MKESLKLFETLVENEISIEHFYSTTIDCYDISFQGKYDSYIVKIYRSAGWDFIVKDNGFSEATKKIKTTCGKEYRNVLIKFA